MQSELSWHDLFDEKIRTWFDDKFKQASPVQESAWAEIAKNKDVLISSPTGSGKTFAAFLYILNQLFVKPSTGVKVLYISPLKALSNDIQINLTKPLEEIGRLFKTQSVTSKSWTGDTTQSDRNKIRRNPPNILVTTPESLYNLSLIHI